jgi:hypothetical protein
MGGRVREPSYGGWRKEVRIVATPKRPSKAALSKAGRDLQNPRTPEKKETEAAKTLAKGRRRKRG